MRFDILMVTIKTSAIWRRSTESTYRLDRILFLPPASG